MEAASHRPAADGRQQGLFYSGAAIARLAMLAGSIQESGGQVRAAAFRDATGLGRKRAIQVLEFFDRVGIARRVRDSHYLRADAINGLGAPPARPELRS